MKYLLCLFLILSIPVFGDARTSQPSEQPGQLIDQQKISKIFDDYLEKQSELLPHVELRFKSIALPKAFRIPKGRVLHRVIPANPGIIGSRRMTLMTRVDGKVVKNQSVRVEVEALAEIAVPTGTFQRGKLLKEQDVELRYQDISRLKSPIFSIDDAVGKRLKRSVRLGEPLQRTQVEFPPVIKRGELVTIQVQRRGLMLTAAGTAKQDGGRGDAIKVENSGSHSVILCRVVAPGLVKVEF